MVNIKGITNIYEPVQTAQAAKKAEVKSGQTDERDSNGRREDQSDQKHHEPMSEEQLSQVIKTIAALPGVKNNHLIVSIEVRSSIKMAIIKDSNGEVVRRIPEKNLWHFLTQGPDQDSKGQLLDKAS